MSPDNKQYLIHISKYLGVALISGSIVHAATLYEHTLWFTILGTVGLVLMVAGNTLEAKETGKKIDSKFLLMITALAFATGFLSGGAQHYFDSPIFAGWLLAIGAIVTYVTFFAKDGKKPPQKGVVAVIAVASVIMLLSYFVVDHFAVHIGGHHH